MTVIVLLSWSDYLPYRQLRKPDEDAKAAREDYLSYRQLRKCLSKSIKYRPNYLPYRQLRNRMRRAVNTKLPLSAV